MSPSIPSPDLESILDLSCASSEFAFLATHSLSALLDSGTTSHLMQSRSHFWSYDTTQATGVRTANHGTLDTFGRGDCVVLIRWCGHSLRVRMRDCLHAPGAVINLLSVGRFVEWGFGCYFEDNAVTIRTPPSAGREVC